MIETFFGTLSIVLVGYILGNREQQGLVIHLLREIEDELAYREAGLGKRLKWWLVGRERSED